MSGKAKKVENQQMEVSKNGEPSIDTKGGVT